VTHHSFETDLGSFITMRSTLRMPILCSLLIAGFLACSGAYPAERATPQEWRAHCDALGIKALNDYDCRAGFSRIASALSEKECSDLGGKQGYNSKSAAIQGRTVCQLKTPDAGRICTDKLQCVAACRADEAVPQGQETEGRCGEIWGTPPGCINLVSEGRAHGLICID
jgi:hypothetical protein